MDLSNLHLEKIVIFPKNYKEVIFEKSEIPPEQMSKTIVGGYKQYDEGSRTVRFWHKKPDYNDGDYIFSVAIRIKAVEDKQFDVYDNVLLYILDFDASSQHFKPYIKYIEDWAKQNNLKANLPKNWDKRSKSKAELQYQMTEWLEKQCYANPYYNNVYSEFSWGAYNINVKTTDEKVFISLLKDISIAFRTLA